MNNSNWHCLCCSPIFISLSLASPHQDTKGGKTPFFFLLQKDGGWGFHKLWVGLSPHSFISSWMRREWEEILIETFLFWPKSINFRDLMENIFWNVNFQGQFFRRCGLHVCWVWSETEGGHNGWTREEYGESMTTASYNIKVVLAV